MVAAVFEIHVIEIPTARSAYHKQDDVYYNIIDRLYLITEHETNIIHIL